MSADSVAPRPQNSSVTEPVHRPLEAVHALGKKLKEAVEDRVPRLGVDLLGQLHRPLHVGEQHGHLLALALEDGAGREVFSARWLGV